MQSKLNEILELCIEKSDEENNVFYSFAVCNMFGDLTIEKIYSRSTTVKYWNLVNIDQALECMQNE